MLANSSVPTAYNTFIETPSISAEDGQPEASCSSQSLFSKAAAVVQIYHS
jgi:hypothetical protein